MSLLADLRNYEISTLRKESASKAKQGIKELKKTLGLEGEELNNRIKTSSKAALGLFKWADATDKYYDIFRSVEPKKKQA